VKSKPRSARIILWYMLCFLFQFFCLSEYGLSVGVRNKLLIVCVLVLLLLKTYYSLHEQFHDDIEFSNKKSFQIWNTCFSSLRFYWTFNDLYKTAVIPFIVWHSQISYLSTLFYSIPLINWLSPGKYYWHDCNALLEWSAVSSSRISLSPCYLKKVLL